MKLPDKKAVLQFLTVTGTSLSKKELTDAFGIKGDNRIAFKQLLRELEDEGLIVNDGKHHYRLPEALPPVCVVELYEISIDGDGLLKPVDWQEDTQGPPPRIELFETGGLAIGGRALVRLKKVAAKTYTAQIIKKLDTASARVVGVIKSLRKGYIVMPLDKRAKFDFDITEADFNGAKPGQIAVCEIQPSRGNLRKKVRVIEVVGEPNDPRAISLIASHELGLRSTFPEEVLAETDAMQVPPIGNRTDLRDIPLVTIDGADARDFDDAVFAEEDEKQKGHYNLIVAIADVSYYVRPGTDLDKEAYLRGNSTYFPDRVLPMLPEKLSNDLCSLRPHEDRACLAVHMKIDENGTLISHKFMRALMKSRARLTYEEAQAAKNGNPCEKTKPLMAEVIEPLYKAYAVLDKARINRGALNLEIPERRIVVDETGRMTGVKLRERLDSHKLIEEFMVLANVAAATALENKKAACIYRIHDRPTGDKLFSASNFLESMGLHLPKGGVSAPKQLNFLLDKAATMKTGFLIHEIILRSQAQAVYSPDNIGHFGLALNKYAHFTSPIRRYADLIVHRSLVDAFNFGEGGLSDREKVTLPQIAEHISTTERASAEAERNSVDRFTAAYLSNKIGQSFSGRISGVTRFGLFIKLSDTGADGLIPIRTLPHDFYVHEEQQHALIGRRTGRVFRLGASVMVTLVEADGLTGSTVLELAEGQLEADIEGYKPRFPQQSHGHSAKRLQETQKHRKDKKSFRHKKKNGKNGKNNKNR